MTFRQTLLLCATSACLAVATTQLHATTGTWATSNNGDWDVAANWFNSNLPDGAGEIAAISQNVTGVRTVTLNSTRTVGQLVSQTGGGGNPADPATTRNYRVLGSGTIVLDNGVNIPVVKGINGPFTVGVVLAGTAGVELANGGGSQTLLTGANTYTGDTEIVRGIAAIGNVNALPTFTGNGRTGNILFVDKGSGAGTLDLNANSITINGFSSASGGTVTTRLGTGSYTLTVGDNNQSSTFNGIINNGTGKIGLTKIGTGTQVLGGQNTYTGNTSVDDGELILSDNAKLTFKIGNTGTAGDLTVNNWITGDSTLTLDGDFSFDVSTAALVENNAWNIVDVLNLTENHSSTFSVLGFSDAGGNQWKMQSGAWIWTYDESSGILSVVPEPSTLVLGLLGGVGVLMVLRRRRV